MAKGNILKEAIADAKAVREVALANAKAALEEAFTPKLQNMLSARLSEDLDEDYYEDGDENLELGEDMDEMNIGGTHSMYDEDEKGMDEEIDLEEILNELELEEGKEADSKEEVDEAKKADDDEEDLDEAHRPIYKADEVQLTNPKPEYVHGINENDEFDLDSLLQEINDLEEQQMDMPSGVAQPKQPITRNRNVLRRKKPNKQVSAPSLNKVATRARGAGVPTRAKGVARKGMQVNRMQEGCTDKIAELHKVKKELNETKKAFNSVNSELTEVNLLNSKLLYVNRIFKANTLDDAQKLRVVETLDKAESVNDAKLIYETIKNSFSIANNGKKSIKSTKKPIKESFNKGMASKATGISRTKKVAPKKAILNESGNMVNRFQKLANIKISE